MSSEIKNAVRHRFDTGENFEALVRAARTVEEENQSTSTSTKGKVQAQQHSVPTEETKLDLILKQMQELQKRMDRLEKEPPASKNDVRCYECRKFGHYRNECPLLEEEPTNWRHAHQKQGGRGRGRGRGRGNSRGKTQGQDTAKDTKGEALNSK